jgi:hypothetical protein
MAKQNIRRRKESAQPTPFEQARDEMFQHVMRCGVVGADSEHQAEWFNDTMSYLADRYHELTDAEIAELRAMGERFVQPPKASPVEPESAAASAA